MSNHSNINEFQLSRFLTVAASSLPLLIGVAMIVVSTALLFTGVALPFALAGIASGLILSGTSIGLIALESTSNLRRSELTISDYSEQETPIKKTNESLKVLTLNMGLLSESISKHNKLRSPKQRSLEIATTIRDNYADYDVITLQEGFDPESRAILINALKDIFPHIAHDVGHPLFDGVFYGSGLMVLSKHKITDGQFHANEYPIGTDFFANKGRLSVDLQLPNKQTARVFTTHTHTGGYPKWLKLFVGNGAARRQPHLQAMKQEIEHLQSEKPVDLTVVTGDFNIDLEEQFSHEKSEKHDHFFGLFREYKHDSGGHVSSTLDKKYLIESQKGKETDPSKVVSKTNKGGRVDGVYVTKNSLFSVNSNTVTTFTNSSDHLAVTAEITPISR